MKGDLMERVDLLVTGANGQLGRELCRRASAQGLSVTPAYRPDFDITDHKLVEKVLQRSNASIVVNAAAYTAVDKAEDDPETAFSVNRDGPAFLASCCRELGVPLIHISTDYVFDGTKNEPYVVTDPVNPVNIYGESKAAGENEVRKRHEHHIIIRTSWLYGIEGSNFVKTMLRLGMEKQELRVVSDQFGCPTSAGELSSCILAIAGHILAARPTRWGTYHCCAKGRTSWYGFAQEIFDVAQRHLNLKLERVIPVTTEEFPTKARRPSNSVLDCSAVGHYFGFFPSPWREPLPGLIALLASSMV
ncbi:MAG: dTDP-4-dehydrorhamnose reductase [Desulfatiglandaceae bacterium]